MNRISFVSIPKPFIGHNEIIQRNAIQSWLRLIPADNIFLIGNEAGISAIAKEFGIQQISDVRKTSFGTPLLSDAFLLAQKFSKTDLICYLNTDIILFSDFIEAAEIVGKGDFLMIGRRWNMNVKKSISFSSDWEINLRNKVGNEGILFSEFGIDYFLFPCGMVTSLPDFAVGRPGWDNWLVYHIRSRGIRVIDATTVVTAIHQNHDYAHIPQASVKNSYLGPEAKENIRLAKSFDYLFSINDSTHNIKNGKVVFDFDAVKTITRIKHQHVLLKCKIHLFLVKGIDYVYRRLVYFMTK